MTLDVSPLTKAVGQLEKSLAFSNSNEAKKDPELFVQFRAAAIQAFEYSYELCVKMLQRQLESMSASALNIDHLSFRDLIRTGAEKGLITNPTAWFQYRELRNITAHTYDEEKADRVYKILAEFLSAARLLLKELSSR